MVLTSRISLHVPEVENRAGQGKEEEEEPESIFSDSLAWMFPNDVLNLHGDACHPELVYQSPHLARPVRLRVCDPEGEEERNLFSHYVWNAGLQLAELMEGSTLGVEEEEKEEEEEGGGGKREGKGKGKGRRFDVRGKRMLELGSGAGLPSLLGVVLGAERVVATDYPAEAVVGNLRFNLERCVRSLGEGDEDDGDGGEASRLQASSSSSSSGLVDAAVEGHEWGDLDGDFSRREKGMFDRVVSCDCLWMRWQHDNLRRSIENFMAPGPDSRAWVVGGFHTGRATTGAFFDARELAEVGLEVELIWERDCVGQEREWTVDRGVEDVSERKRWLVIAVLKRTG